MSENVLHTEGLKFEYPNGSSLLFKDLSILKGQHTLILGDSGTGKTTLLHLLGGLSKPTEGKVFIDKTELYKLSDSKLDTFRAQHIGFIFQDAHLIQSLSIAENILLAQSLAKKTKDQEKVTHVLDSLQMVDFANKRPQQLSRGQLQRAAIARAVINNPSIIIADEPTASLDDNNTEHVIELLMATAQTHGSTLIIATHDKRLKDHFSTTYFLK